jgi:hypothetical protein
MPSFSDASITKLSTCDGRLIKVFNIVIVEFDCTIIEGHRPEERQDELFRTGFSKVEWPDSEHNVIPSRAVDSLPYPIDWEDWERNRTFGGYVLGVASQLDIPLRWGGDWDRDWTLNDQTFIDLPHFEIWGPT